MLSSLLSSWADHISQSRALTECTWSEPITTCLVVMVSKAWKDIIRGHPQLHGATPEDVISLACMALLFIREYCENRACQDAEGILSSYRRSDPDIYNHIKSLFKQLKDVNLEGSGSPEDVAALCANMTTAARNLLGIPQQ